MASWFKHRQTIFRCHLKKYLVRYRRTSWFKSKISSVAMHFEPLVRISRCSERLRKTQDELLAVFAAKHEVQHSGKVCLRIFSDTGSGSEEMHEWIRTFKTMCISNLNWLVYRKRRSIFFYNILFKPFDKSNQQKILDALFRR